MQTGQATWCIEMKPFRISFVVLGQVFCNHHFFLHPSRQPLRIFQRNHLCPNISHHTTSISFRPKGRHASRRPAAPPRWPPAAWAAAVVGPLRVAAPPPRHPCNQLPRPKSLVKPWILYRPAVREQDGMRSLYHYLWQTSQCAHCGRRLGLRNTLWEGRFASDSDQVEPPENCRISSVICQGDFFKFPCVDKM